MGKKRKRQEKVKKLELKERKKEEHKGKLRV